jgi:xanthine dehydrogenase molybdopterin-binding subunit B
MSHIAADMAEVTNAVMGIFYAGAEYHFAMETQTCMCVPVEDGMDVYPSTQTVNMTDMAIAEVLNIPENRWVLDQFYNHLAMYCPVIVTP